MKKLLALSLALTMCLAAACSGGAAPEAPAAEQPADEAPVDDAPAAEAPAGDVTLKTVSMFGGNDPAAPAYANLVGSFMEATGVKVEDASDASLEEWKASVITDFTTGNEPDVLFFFSGIDAEPIRDKVVAFDTIKAAYPDYAKDIFPDALEIMRENDGNIYAVPVKGFWEGIYCNKDMFDEYGLELPTTWANLVKAIDTFRENDIDPFAISFAEEPHYMIEALIMSAGGVEEHKVVPTTDVTSAPESWARGLDMFKSLGDLGAFPADAATKKSATAQDDFYNKRAAMFADGSWRTGGIIENGRAENVVVVAMPQIPGGKGTGTDIVCGFSSGFYITKKAWSDPVKQKACVDFVMHMTTPEAIFDLLAGGASLPAAAVEVDPNASLVLQSATEMCANAKGLDMPIDSRLKKSAWTEIWTRTADLASGAVTGQEVLADAIPQNKD